MLTRRNLVLSALSAPFIATRSGATIVPPGKGDQTRALKAAIEIAAKSDGVLQLGAGTYETGLLILTEDVSIIGIPGATRLRASAEGHIFSMQGAKNITIQGVHLSSKGTKGNLIWAEGIERLVVEGCDFSGGEAGIRISACGGRISGNRFRFHQKVGVQSIASTGMEISGNSVTDCGNIGIQLARSQKGDNPSIISNNFVARIAAEDGGDGPNGNGINVYASHGAIVANNRIADCAFTGIRNASSDMCTIMGNQISRCNETALYVEFEFSGAVVANNIIDTASQGISITNFLQGGRLASCTGNVVRNIRGKDAHGNVLGGGIAAEADVVIANNVIENTERYGVGMGWGKYARNLSAHGNIVKDTPYGIVFSAVGPGPFVVSDNVISGASNGAIIGMDHTTPITEDLVKPGAKIPDMASISGNIVRS